MVVDVLVDGSTVVLVVEMDDGSVVLVEPGAAIVFDVPGGAPGAGELVAPSESVVLVELVELLVEVARLASTSVVGEVDDPVSNGGVVSPATTCVSGRSRTSLSAALSA